MKGASHTPPFPASRYRPLRELGFKLRFLRLVMALLFEAIACVAHIFLFLFRRRSQRARIREIMLKQSGPEATGWLACVFVLLLPLFFFVGCSSKEAVAARSELRHSGKKGFFEFKESLHDLLSMEDAQRSLEDDLQDLGEVTPFDEVRGDVMDIVTIPDAQSSLEDDLRELGDPELGSFWDTIELFGL